MFCPCRSVRTQMCHGRGPPRSCPPRPVQSTLMMSGSLRSGAASCTTCISTGSVTPLPPSNLRDVTALSVSLFPVLSSPSYPRKTVLWRLRWAVSHPNNLGQHFASDHAGNWRACVLQATNWSAPLGDPWRVHRPPSGAPGVVLWWG